jgi:hypothetical protein
LREDSRLLSLREPQIDLPVIRRVGELGGSEDGMWRMSSSSEEISRISLSCVEGDVAEGSVLLESMFDNEVTDISLSEEVMLEIRYIRVSKLPMLAQRVTKRDCSCLICITVNGVNHTSLPYLRLSMEPRLLMKATVMELIRQLHDLVFSRRCVLVEV